MAKREAVDLDYLPREILFNLADRYKALYLATNCDGVLDKAKTMEAMALKRGVGSP
ncbi:MAG: hypothetical protein P4N41_19925 [Negativicutes bacterium]|nr:hypothetical protein [Negativicutes bacterium]